MSDTDTEQNRISKVDAPSFYFVEAKSCHLTCSVRFCVFSRNTGKICPYVKHCLSMWNKLINHADLSQIPKSFFNHQFLKLRLKCQNRQSKQHKPICGVSHVHYCAFLFFFRFGAEERNKVVGIESVFLVFRLMQCMNTQLATLLLLQVNQCTFTVETSYRGNPICHGGSSAGLLHWR